ncbi:hypothetical protein VTJ83DRAFT_337 [Remersonia thermophila]|uniref:DUF1772-domain-containing protein n=1 Tax=Remersonia thermophila TaxID=72144 RepID=A0ABR4DM41_9PEZI
MSPAAPSPSTAVRLAQGTAILLSSVAAGTSLSLSFFLVPRLLESPTPLMLKQWIRTYARGKRAVPLASLAAAASYLYLGLGNRYLHPHLLTLGQARAYLAAAALTLGIVPYTKLFMAGTNGRLLKLEESAGLAAASLEGKAADAADAAAEAEVEAQRERSAKGLVDWWGVLNLGRAGLLLAGSVCGLAATI